VVVIRYWGIFYSGAEVLAFSIAIQSSTHSAKPLETMHPQWFCSVNPSMGPHKTSRSRSFFEIGVVLAVRYLSIALQRRVGIRIYARSCRLVGDDRLARDHLPA
jgi:hypothetical protein